MIIANNQLGWLLHWNEEIQDIFNLVEREFMTHTGYGGLNTFEQQWNN